jgi:hypothetical protein
MRTDSYTQIGGRPVFVVYRPQCFVNPDATVSLYREEFKRAGLHPAIGFFVKNVSDMEYSAIFDFCYLFEPRLFFNFHGVRKSRSAINAYHRLTRSVSSERRESASEWIVRLLNVGCKRYRFTEFLTYFDSPARKELIRSSACPVQNVVTCGWNNAPRYRQHFTELEVPRSEQMSSMLKLSRTAPGCSDSVPLLCNAWNEWSEGAALEPCSYLGDALLREYLRE